MSTFVLLTSIGAALFAAVTIALQHNTARAIKYARGVHGSNEVHEIASAVQASDDAKDTGAVSLDVSAFEENLAKSINEISASIARTKAGLASSGYPVVEPLVKYDISNLGMMSGGLARQVVKPHTVMIIKNKAGELVERLTRDDGTIVEILLPESMEVSVGREHAAPPPQVYVGKTPVSRSKRKRSTSTES